MDIMNIVAVGIISAVLAILVKKQSPELGILVSIAGGVLVFFMLLPDMIVVLNVLSNLSQNITTDMEHIPIIFKILGIAYIAEFATQICKDAGEGAIASKIELGGKVIIMVISAPIIVSFLNLIVTMLP